MLKNRRENPKTECKYLYEFKESKSSPFENKGLSIAINSILVLIPVPSKISTTISIQSAISDIDICIGDTVQVVAQVSGGDGGLYNYVWSNSSITDSIIFLSPTSTQTYSLNVSDLCETPDVSVSFEVRVNTYPVADFSADILESLIGAIYLDAGYAVTQKIIEKIFHKQLYLKKFIGEKDAKTTLQEYCHSKKIDLPQYKHERIKSPDHNPIFYVTCTIDKLCITIGVECKNVAEGHKITSRRVLERLKDNEIHKDNISRKK